MKNKAKFYRDRFCLATTIGTWLLSKADGKWNYDYNLTSAFVCFTDFEGHKCENWSRSINYFFLVVSWFWNSMGRRFNSSLGLLKPYFYWYKHLQNRSLSKLVFFVNSILYMLHSPLFALWHYLLLMVIYVLEKLKRFDANLTNNGEAFSLWVFPAFHKY